mgnify:CR=1 FL=1
MRLARSSSSIELPENERVVVLTQRFDDYLITPNRHTGAGRYPNAFEIHGFRVALAIASLPGMTIQLYREFPSHHTRVRYPQNWNHAARGLPIARHKQGQVWSC